MPAGEIPRTPAEPGDIPERFKDAGEVISCVSQMYSADQRRAIWRSDVERLWSGEPVYPLSKLREAGQAWRARTNYRGLEGLISKENSLDYDLETQGKGIVRVALDIPPSQLRDDQERLIEEQFKWLIQTRWKSYNFHVQKRIHNKNLHGMGFHLWMDTTDNWIPRTPNPGEVLFPDQCPFNFSEDGDYFVVRDFMPSYVLYRKIENEKQARILGWDVDMVWKALTQIVKQTGKYQTYGNLGVDNIAKRMRDGDIGYYTTHQSGCWINHVFVREYETGKVSQYSVAEGLDLNQYLYKKRNKYEDWPIEIFPYDIGTGSLHSVKGLGDRTKEFFEMMNRVQNCMVDQVQLGAYPTMQQKVQNMDPDKMKLARLGGMNWTPYGAEPSLLKFPDLSSGPLALKDDLERTMEKNNRGSGSESIEQKDRMTADEYSMRAQDINRLSTGSEAFQRSILSKFYNRILKLAVKPSSSGADWAVMAREFRKRLDDRGVPQEVLGKIGEINAVVAYGKGSASARQNAYLSLFQSPAYANTSDDRRIQIDRGYVASLFGQDGVQEYCRSNEDSEMPNGDASLAVQENNGMMNGGDALAEPRQDQTTHLQIHFSGDQKLGIIGIMQLVQAYMDGQADPKQAYGAVQKFGAHIKQHLDYLQQNPMKGQEFKAFFNQWQALSRIADKMKADIESASEATPPEQQVSEKLQIGLAGVDAKKEVDTMKATNKAQLDMQKQAFKERMSAAQLQTHNQREDVKLATTVQRDNAATVATIAQDTALTAADIQNKNRKTNERPTK